MKIENVCPCCKKNIYVDNTYQTEDGYNCEVKNFSFYCPYENCSAILYFIYDTFQVVDYNAYWGFGVHTTFINA